MTLLKRIKKKEFGENGQRLVQVGNKLKKPNAITMIADDLMLCADDCLRAIYQIPLEFNGVTVISPDITHIAQYPPGVKFVTSMVVLGETQYMACQGEVKGLFSLTMGNLTVTDIVSGVEVSRLSVYNENSILFGNNTAAKVCIYDVLQKSISDFAESGKHRVNDGSLENASFQQIQGICVEGRTVYVADYAGKSVKLITGMAGNAKFVCNLGLLYDTFGIHSKGMNAENVSLNDVIDNLSVVNDFVKSTATSAKAAQNLTRESLNGPEGVISAKTRDSLKILEVGV